MQKQVLTFPAEWGFRIIGSDRPDLIADIRKVLFTLGFSATVVAAGQSGSGKFRTYSAALTLPSREALTQAAYALSKIPGVRMVI